MTTLLPDTDLPTELTPNQAVEAAYARELAEVASKLQSNLPCLVAAQVLKAAAAMLDLDEQPDIVKSIKLVAESTI
jgi:hypothetical protein